MWRKNCSAAPSPKKIFCLGSSPAAIILPCPPPHVSPLSSSSADDVFIKGANAIDRLGHVGILNADPTGGTIGQALPIINARGSRLIVPVGLEKMIPSVAEAARRLGIERLTHGLPGPGGEAKTGMVPLINADVVTEIVALRILAGVTATHVASGGVNGAEGSAGFVIEGSAPAVERALTLIKNIKGEPNLIIPGV
jgi:hypothetical protein